MPDRISLRDARWLSGLTQGDVAKALGVTPMTVRHWETGKTEPKATQFLQLCALYGQTVDGIFLPKYFN